MLTDRESRVVGPLVVAFGTAFFAAGLARILWPAADGTIYLASLGVGFGFPLFAAGLWSIWADVRLTNADILDREAERKAKAGPVVTPDEPLAPEPVTASLSSVNPYPDRWATFWRRLAQAGDAYGWTQAALTTEGSPTKVVSETAWDMATDAMIANGWLTEKRTGRPTKWAVEDGLTAFEKAEGWKALPCPHQEPPEIALPPYRTPTPRRATTRATSASRAVIDG